MIKKRKGKNSKFARMSDEERARYMQHRAEFELETKRRKQQLIAIFTKNKLKREEVFSRLNVAKINVKWRCVLRQIKCNELYDDVKHLSETFDRVIRLKDETIRRLHDELEIANIDHRKLQEANIILIDDIIGKHKRRLQILHDIPKLEDIKTKSLIELNELKNCMEQNCQEIQNKIHRKSKLLEEGQSLVKIQNAINIRNLLYLDEDTASTFINQSFAKMESLWDQLNEVITDYENMTEDKRKQYEYLKEQDNLNQLCISYYPKVNLQLQNVIDNFKNEMQKLSVKREDKIEKLRTNITHMKTKMKRIKHEFTRNQITDIIQLKKLTITCNEVLKCLQTTMEKGALILKVIKTCSTLEPLLFNLREYFVQNAVYDEAPHIHVPKACDKIDKFWEQYNHMKAGNILLKKESEKLCLENKMLRYKLQAYLVSVFGVPKWQYVASTAVKQFLY